MVSGTDALRLPAQLKAYAASRGADWSESMVGWPMGKSVRHRGNAAQHFQPGSL